MANNDREGETKMGILNLAMRRGRGRGRIRMGAMPGSGCSWVLLVLVECQHLLRISEACVCLMTLC